MRIGGFQKFSLIDYPGKCAAVVFTQGCNFRCSYCHNPELVDPALFGPPLDEGDILRFLETRRGLLDGVVVTGGEPTIQRNLTAFLGRIKSMGFAVKLDTNGSRPGVLSGLLSDGLVDFVAMDVKAPVGSYGSLAGVPVNEGDLRESVSLIRRSGLGHLFRTTRTEGLDIPLLTGQWGVEGAHVTQPCLPVAKDYERRSVI